MLGKIKNVHLIIILFGLVALVLLFRYINKSKDSSFSNNFNIETKDIKSFTIQPKVSREDKLNFYIDEKSNWIVKNDSIKADVQEGVLDQLFDGLEKLKYDRLVSKSKDSWAKYELEDTLCTKLQIRYNDDTDESIYIGKVTYSTYDPNGGRGYSNFKSTTYFRVGKSDNVYALENGSIDFVDNTFNFWRNKNLLKLSTEDLIKIDFKYKDKESFSVDKNPQDKWIIGENQVDSAAIKNYFSEISFIELDSNYLDNYSPRNEIARLDFILSNKQSVTVTINEENEFNVINSSSNPNTFFKIDKKESPLYSKIFKKSDFFVK